MRVSTTLHSHSEREATSQREREGFLLAFSPLLAFPQPYGRLALLLCLLMQLSEVMPTRKVVGGVYKQARNIPDLMPKRVK
jgi:hypothetical protein